MSDRRRRKDVEVYGFLDPDLEVVLKARNSLSDPDKWIQGHLGKGQRKCLAGHLLNAGARTGDGLNRIAVKLGFAGCSEMVEFNDTHTYGEVLARVDEGIHRWSLLDVSNQSWSARSEARRPGSERVEFGLGGK